MTTTDNPTANTLRELIKRAGVKFKTVEAYGSQVVVTCWCEASAKAVANLLVAGSFIFRGIVHTWDDTKDEWKDTQTPHRHEVWRAFFRA